MLYFVFTNLCNSRVVLGMFIVWSVSCLLATLVLQLPEGRANYHCSICGALNFLYSQNCLRRTKPCLLGCCCYAFALLSRSFVALPMSCRFASSVIETGLLKSHLHHLPKVHKSLELECLKVLNTFQVANGDELNGSYKIVGQLVVLVT